MLKYLEIPDGWIKACGLDKEKGEGGKLPGKASYNFEAPRDDTYFLFLRAQWFDDCGNSVYVKFDDSPKWLSIEDNLGMNTKTNYSWVWHPLMQEGAVKGIPLKKGAHKLWLNVREDGPKLDQWLIATDANTPSEKPLKNRP